MKTEELKSTPRWEIYYRPVGTDQKMSMYPVFADTPEEAFEKFRERMKTILAFNGEGVEYWLCPNPVKSGIVSKKGDTDYG